MNKAVFLDRDGVINEDKGFVYKIEAFIILPGVVEALLLLQQHHYKLIVITSQSGIGRGLYSEEDFLKLDDYMREYFNKQGIKIEKTYYCPHAPEINCECRKPKPGMLLQAIQEHDIDIQHSWFIGDKITDFEAGNAAGVHSLLIDSLYVKDMNIKKFRDLAEAVHYILLRDKNI